MGRIHWVRLSGQNRHLLVDLLLLYYFNSVRNPLLLEEEGISLDWLVQGFYQSGQHLDEKGFITLALPQCLQHSQDIRSYPSNRYWLGKPMDRHSS